MQPVFWDHEEVSVSVALYASKGIAAASKGDEITLASGMRHYEEGERPTW